MTVPSNTKYCHYCGQKIASIAEICPQCGVRQFTPPSRTERDSPSKIAACLFAIFLGLFGAHKFYLGQTRWGAFYLLMSVPLFETYFVMESMESADASGLLVWLMSVPLFLTHFALAIIWIICLVEDLVYLTYTDRDFADRYSRD